MTLHQKKTPNLGQPVRSTASDPTLRRIPCQAVQLGAIRDRDLLAEINEHRDRALLALFLPMKAEFKVATYCRVLSSNPVLQHLLFSLVQQSQEVVLATGARSVFEVRERTTSTFTRYECYWYENALWFVFGIIIG